MFVDAAADASSLGLTDTVTDPTGTTTVSVNFNGGATLVAPTDSFGLSDQFNGSPLPNFPSSLVGSGGAWNFYDDYVFTVGAGTSIQGAVVSFTNGIVGIGDLQGRIISTSSGYSATTAQNDLGTLPAGQVVEDSWTTMALSGGIDTINLDATTLTPGTYVLQVRGDVGSSGSGSYGGSVSFSAVPLPAAFPLMLTGLGLFGGVGAFRRRRPTGSV
jgi:hypothetical protein